MIRCEVIRGRESGLLKQEFNAWADKQEGIDIIKISDPILENGWFLWVFYVVRQPSSPHGGVSPQVTVKL